MLVATNTADTARSIIAGSPEITFVRARTTTIAAIRILAILSIVPTFFFISSGIN